jgi:hypothetical protein
MSVAAQILARHTRYPWEVPGGEWGLLQGETRAAYRALLGDGDEAGLTAMLASMFRTPACAGLVSCDYRDCGSAAARAELVVGMRKSLRFWSAVTDQDDVRILAAPAFGAPILVEVEGVPIMIDTPRHDVYAVRLHRLLPAGGTVVELGGGFGGCACQVHRHGPGLQMVLCDLPATLYLAWAWLATTTALRVAWWDEDPTADVVLLPAADCEHWDRADVVFASHSLGEMEVATVRRYLAWLHQIRPRYFYHESPHTRPPTDGGRTSDVFPEVMALQCVPGPPYREVFRAPPAWPWTGGRYWEFLYEREAA